MPVTLLEEGIPKQLPERFCSAVPAAAVVSSRGRDGAEAAAEQQAAGRRGKAEPWEGKAEKETKSVHNQATKCTPSSGSGSQDHAG